MRPKPKVYWVADLEGINAARNEIYGLGKPGGRYTIDSIKASIYETNQPNLVEHFRHKLLH